MNTEKAAVKVRVQGALERLTGFLLLIQILVGALDNLSLFSRVPVHVTLLFAAALVVLSALLWRSWLERRVRQVGAFLQLVEGLAVVISALILLDLGKVRMPLFLLFIGLVLILVGLAQYAMRGRGGRQVSRWFLRGMGVLFLLAGGLGLGAVLLTDRDGWALGASSLLLLLGLVFLLLGPRMLRMQPDGSHQEKTPPTA